MTKKEKYYGTTTLIRGDMRDKLMELGYKGSHSQFRVVCKAKSRAEANRIAKSYGFEENVFQANCTSETRNVKELELCDKYVFIVKIDGTQVDNYVGIEELTRK